MFETDKILIKLIFHNILSAKMMGSFIETCNSVILYCLVIFVCSITECLESSCDGNLKFT